jgi:hypothetical protein
MNDRSAPEDARSTKTSAVEATIEHYADFYDGLSFRVMTFIPVGTRSLMSLDTYMFASMASTLRSMAAVLAMGSVNDAYALARKLHDAVLVGTYITLYLGKHMKVGFPVVEQIDDWITGKKALPRTGAITKFVDGAIELDPIRGTLAHIDYDGIRSRCNDHTHHNFLRNLLLNDGRVHVGDRVQWIARLADDTRDIVIQHLAYTFCLSGHYMMSNDYIDAIEMGMVPDAAAENWVAPQVQDFMREHVGPRVPDLIPTLREHTGMALED